MVMTYIAAHNPYHVVKLSCMNLITNNITDVLVWHSTLKEVRRDHGNGFRASLAKCYEL